MLNRTTPPQASKPELNLTMRAYIPELDRNLIIDSWIETTEKYNRWIIKNLYAYWVRELIDRLLARSQTTIATLGDGHKVGYLVMESWMGQPVIHFAWTEYEHRNKGVLTAMLRNAGLNLYQHVLIASTWCQFLNDNRKHQKFAIIYNPFAIHDWAKDHKPVSIAEKPKLPRVNQGRYELE